MGFINRLYAGADAWFKDNNNDTPANVASFVILIVGGGLVGIILIITFLVVVINLFNWWAIPIILGSIIIPAVIHVGRQWWALGADN